MDIRKVSGREDKLDNNRQISGNGGDIWGGKKTILIIATYSTVNSTVAIMTEQIEANVITLC
jgi:hypothetical protein